MNWKLIGQFLWIVSVLFCCAAAAGAAQMDNRVAVRFNRDIRPILAAKCFACHGPDAQKREADLRLDTASGLLGEEADSGVVIAKKPGESQLFERLTTSESDLKMPPPETGKEITAAEIELIRLWIEQGAEYEGHWAFQPVAPPASIAESIPLAVQIDRTLNSAWSLNQIEPAPMADPRTLLRRLSFDLLGLPPASEDVERFAFSPQIETYEQFVDQFMASPHFGERLALWWLDLVRYADSVGYHGDQSISVSPYRDYVIEAFNQNMPFDQFTIEQLAGDLLPSPTRDQLIASGYNRLGMMSAEGGVQDREYLAKYMAERVRNASGTWLGITMGCAECHDHKFDPISTKEFYQFAAFFADIEERGLYSGAHESGEWGPTLSVPTPEQDLKLKRLVTELNELRTTLSTSTPELEAARKQWETTVSGWQILEPNHVESESKTVLTVRPDHSILASGPTAAEDRYLLRFANVPAGTRAFRLEVLPDSSLPNQGPGRAGNGNFVLSEWQARVVATDGIIDQESLLWSGAEATFEQHGSPGNNPYGKWAIAAAIDLDVKGRPWGWAIAEQTGKSQEAVFHLAHPLNLAPGEQLELILEQRHTNPQHVLGCFRVSAALADNSKPTVLSAEIRQLVGVQQSERTSEQNLKLAEYFLANTPLLEEVRNKLTAVESEKKALEKSITTTPITRATSPRPVRVLARGNWMDENGELVAPQFPVALTKSLANNPDARRTRMDLALWLVDHRNPLTARVLANRVWKLFWGTGLSRKLDDLGSQGEWPAHLELLDLLANDLHENHWDLRRLIKGIVMSEAYRHDSAPTEFLERRDPDNRWLARQNRFRLDAEFVRDIALATSGLLVREVGGRSVFPEQPPGYWAHLNFPTREWQASSGPERYRRGLYMHWQRQYLHPSLIAFDAPNREECTADRPRSNTPLQALVLLNDPNYVEAARAFGERIMRCDSQVFSEKVQWAWMQATARNPTADELQVVTEFWHSQVEGFRIDLPAAQALLSVGGQAIPSELDGAELAAWTSVARVILNLHETVSRY